MKYTYVIDLDERGEFLADVRDENENVLFEVRNDHDLDGEVELVVDGFMRHCYDTKGLCAYLKESGILPYDAELEISA